MVLLLVDWMVELLVLYWAVKMEDLWVEMTVDE